MSLATLKRLLLGRAPAPTPGGPASKERSGSSQLPLSCGSSHAGTQGDLEAQSSLPAERDASSRKPALTARVISDATIGLSDGLTVPFALTAGLSALGDTRIVIFGGLAELIAGAISMGLGGYLGAKSEVASYAESLSETHTLLTNPTRTRKEITTILTPLDLPPPKLDDLAAALHGSAHLADFLMRFQHGGPAPSPHRALASALTIAGGYFVGGLVPLLPYFCIASLYTALYVSIAVMALALFAFGYAKTCAVRGWAGWARVCGGVGGGLQMVVVGGAAAAAAWGLVRAFNGVIGEKG